MAETPPAFSPELFKRLSYGNKKELLDQLLLNCSLSELFYLKQKLHERFETNFVKFLPSEASSYLFSLLDPRTLVICCQVCKCWNEFISNCTEIWRPLCFKYGFKLGGFETQNGVLNAKDVFCKGMDFVMRAQRGELVNPQGDSQLDWQMHQSYHHHVSCLAYNNDFGYIVAAHDNRKLSLCKLHSGELVSSKWTLSTVSCIFTKGEHVACGSFRGLIYLYTIGENKFESTRILTGHSGVVYCIDWAGCGSCFISGSSDKTVKVWSNELYPILSIDRHQDWVTEVLAAEEDIVGFRIISKSKLEIFVWCVTVEPAEVNLLKAINLNAKTCCGLFLVDKCLVFGSLTGDIYVYNLITGSMLRNMHTHKEMNGIFAVGTHFIAVMFSDLSCGIYNTFTGTQLFKWTCPYLEYSPMLSNIACIGGDWLSRIDINNAEKFYILYVKRSGDIGKTLLEIG